MSNSTARRVPAVPLRRYSTKREAGGIAAHMLVTPTSETTQGPFGAWSYPTVQMWVNVGDPR